MGKLSLPTQLNAIDSQATQSHTSTQVSMQMVLPPNRRRCFKALGGGPRASGWLVLIMCCGLAAPLWAQRPGAHYLNHAAMPPGAIGSWQLLRGGAHAGYFQPVEIKAPEGALVSLAVEGRLDQLQPAPRLAGMLIGAVYRLRVANVASLEQAEVFPTIEVIDRLYPPENQAARFPIVIELTEDDLRLAAEGKFVTRVIYLEDPDNALPVAQEQQGWFEVAAGEDPLRVADELGRPVAIVRMGGRLPDDAANPGLEFLYGAPPWQAYQPRGMARRANAPSVPPAARSAPSLNAPAVRTTVARREYFDAPPRLSGQQERYRR